IAFRNSMQCRFAIGLKEKPSMKRIQVPDFANRAGARQQQALAALGCPAFRQDARVTAIRSLDSAAWMLRAKSNACGPSPCRQSVWARTGTQVPSRARTR